MMFILYTLVLELTESGFRATWVILERPIRPSTSKGLSAPTWIPITHMHHRMQQCNVQNTCT